MLFCSLLPGCRYCFLFGSYFDYPSLSYLCFICMRNMFASVIDRVRPVVCFVWQQFECWMLRKHFATGFLHLCLAYMHCWFLPFFFNHC